MKLQYTSQENIRFLNPLTPGLNEMNMSSFSKHDNIAVPNFNSLSNSPMGDKINQAR